MIVSEPACLMVAYQRFEQIPLYIRQGLDAGVKNFYLAVDGGKSEKDKSSQSIEIEKLLNLPLPPHSKLFVWHRDRNLGLAASIITALDWFFLNEESGIILEDDLLLHESFFDFCKIHLKEFRKSQEVFSVSGNQFFPSAPDRNFGNYPLIWGWATWRDRWLQIRKIYNFKTNPAPMVSFPGGISVAGFWKAGLHRVERGILSSWALPFATHSRLNGWVHVYPSINLVRNIGNDQFAQHTSKLAEVAYRPFSQFEFEIMVPRISKTGIDFMNVELERDFFFIRRRHMASAILARLEAFFLSKASYESLENQLCKIQIPLSRFL